MVNASQLPQHNLGLYRLRDAVGRLNERARLKAWLQAHPVAAITGPSGAGKSTLATMLAVDMANQFDQGILWISATGNTPFTFYDIVRTLEDIFATGITSQVVNAWPLIVLQQLYGANRLVILDELTDADPETVDNILAMIGQIRPGGGGRFLLIGRTLPLPLLDIAGDAHLSLDGLQKSDVHSWVVEHEEVYPIVPEQSQLLHHFTGGHPLAVKIVAGLWNNEDRGQLFDLVSVQDPGDWEARLKAIVVAALATLNRDHPQASRLLIRCSQALGGFDADAIKHLYWRIIHGDTSAGNTSLAVAVHELLRRGLLLFNPEDNRYFIHPLIRRYLTITGYAGLTEAEKFEDAFDHATYYLQIAQRIAHISPPQWHILDQEWGNIRKAFDFLSTELETQLGIHVTDDILALDHADLQSTSLVWMSPKIWGSTRDNLGGTPQAPRRPKIRDAPLALQKTIQLVRDYALTLRGYIVSRHPPEGFRWLSAGIIAVRCLFPNHRRSEALLCERLAALAFARQEYETALTWYRQALAFFRETADYLRSIQLMVDLGITMKNLGRYDQALDIYGGALHLAQISNLALEKAAIQAHIGELYYNDGDYEAALSWYNRSLDLESHHRHKEGQAERHNQIGRVFEAQSQYDAAIDHYKAAATIYENTRNPKGLSITYDNLGSAYFHAGRPEEALLWYELDLAIMDGMGNWFDLAATLHNMGHIALETDDYPTATDYFLRSRDIYLQFGQLELAEEEQQLLMAIPDQQSETM